MDHQPVDSQGRQDRLHRLSPYQPREQILLFRSSGYGQGRHFVGSGRAVPGPARLHAVDHLPASQPVLAIPADPGRPAARAGRGAHRRNRQAGPPPRRLTSPAVRSGRGVDSGAAVARHTPGLNQAEAFPQPSDEPSGTTQFLGGTRQGHQHLNPRGLAETPHFGTSCPPSL
jgi:hypothetical protein